MEPRVTPVCMVVTVAVAAVQCFNSWRRWRCLEPVAVDLHALAAADHTAARRKGGRAAGRTHCRRRRCHGVCGPGQQLRVGPGRTEGPALLGRQVQRLDVQLPPVALQAVSTISRAEGSEHAVLLDLGQQQEAVELPELVGNRLGLAREGLHRHHRVAQLRRLVRRVPGHTVWVRGEYHCREFAADQALHSQHEASQRGGGLRAAAGISAGQQVAEGDENPCRVRLAVGRLDSTEEARHLSQDVLAES